MKGKNTLLLLLVLFVGMIIMPSITKAAETKYNTLNLKEALAEEEIEEAFTDYKETDDQAIIYLFRGKGCGYCRAFLTFLNSITDEYGKYFKLVSYEVWYDEANSKLLTNVSNYMEQPAGGVPYIVIGDKVFAGYSSNYDEDIKAAIKTLYDTKTKKRYDVMEKMAKDPNKKSSSGDMSTQTWTIVICNFVFVLIASLLVMSHFNNKFNVLYEKLNDLNTRPVKEVKVEEKPKTVKNKKASK